VYVGETGLQVWHCGKGQQGGMPVAVQVWKERTHRLLTEIIEEVEHTQLGGASMRRARLTQTHTHTHVQHTHSLLK